MKKFAITLISLIIIVIVALFISPMGMGIWLQRNFPKILETNKLGRNISYKITDYKRGWFTSTATVEATIHLKNQRSEHFIIHNTLYHGPLLDVKTVHGDTWQWGRVYYVARSNAPGYRFVGHVLVKLNGLVIGRSRDSIFRWADRNFSANASGVSSQFRINPKVQRFTLTAAASHINIDHRTTMHGLVLSLNIKMADPIWLGTRQLKIKSLTQRLSPSLTLAVHDLDSRMTVTRDGERFNTHIILSFQSALLGKQKLGPGELSLAVDGVTVKGFDVILKTFHELNAKHKVSTLERLRATTQLLQFLSHGLTLKLHMLSLVTPSGKLHAQGQLFIPKTQGLAGVLKLFTQTKMNVNVSLPKKGWSWIPSEDYRQKIAALLSNPNIKITNGTLKLHFQLQRGKLLLNGQPFQPRIGVNNGS